MKKLLFGFSLFAGLCLSAVPAGAVIPYNPGPTPTPLNPQDSCLKSAREALGRCLTAVRSDRTLDDKTKATEELVCYHIFNLTVVDCYCRPPNPASYCGSDCVTNYRICRVDADHFYAVCNALGLQYCSERRDRDRCICDVVLGSCPYDAAQSRVDACEDLVPQPPLPRDVDPDDDGDPGCAGDSGASSECPIPDPGPSARPTPEPPPAAPPGR